MLTPRPVPSDTSPPIAQVLVEMLEAKKRYAEENPDRHKIYQTLVGRKWTAERGKRNTHMVEIVTFLFSAVCEAVAMEFVEQFYLRNSIAFNDPLEQHMREARAHWQTLASGYPEGIEAGQRELYVALPPIGQALFRIARSLASLPKESEDERSTLNLPMTHTGHRLGTSGSAVGRMIKRFQTFGLLEVVYKGSQTRKRPDGSMVLGKPAIYRWKLGLDETPDSEEWTF